MDKDSKDKKAKRVRSRLYPRYNLETALDFAKLIDKLGGTNVAQETVLSEMGKNQANDPVFSGRVSSTKQFGLIEPSQSSYSITEAAKKILYPTPDTDERQLMKQAFLGPDIYGGLINRFNEKELPIKNTLGNILFNEFGISRNSRNRAAKVFIESAEYAGVLKDNKLIVDITPKTTKPVHDAQSKPTPYLFSPFGPTVKQEVPEQNKNINIPVFFDQKDANRTGSANLPLDLSEPEAKLFFKIICLNLFGKELQI